MRIFHRRRVERLAESAAAALHNSRLEVRLAASAAEAASRACDRALSTIEAEEETGVELLEAGLELVGVRARIPVVHRAAERAVALVFESDSATVELAIACASTHISLADCDEVMASTAAGASERAELANELTKFSTEVIRLMGKLNAGGPEEHIDFAGEFERIAAALSPQVSDPHLG